jgi:hypothetical protein
MRLAPGLPRGITTVDDLRERSIVDPATHCWQWQGATHKGHAAMWAFDHARGEKRTLRGPLAVWNLAHGEAPPPGWIIFVGCGNPLCVNPAHQRRAKDRKEYGAHVRRAGWLRGIAVDKKVAALKKARAARGVVDTPAAVVELVRSMPDLPGAEVARRLGIDKSRVYDIRAGRTHASIGQLEDTGSAVSRAYGGGA